MGRTRFVDVQVIARGFNFGVFHVVHVILGHNIEVEAPDAFRDGVIAGQFDAVEWSVVELNQIFQWTVLGLG